jgi:corrinoid protein of di/trimethylamine methyltransferase
MGRFEAIAENLQKGKASRVKELVQQALAEGAGPDEILEEGLLFGMAMVGQKFRNNEVYIPEVLIAARAMNAGAALLRPLLTTTGERASGTVVIGTMKGDLHDIGKNLVKMMMEARGLEVIDLGVDVPAARFVQAAGDGRADIVACSALLTTTMLEMEAVVVGLGRAGLRGKVKTMVGGAPVNQGFSQRIGADLYAPNAVAAAEAAVALLAGAPPARPQGPVRRRGVPRGAGRAAG